MSPQSTSTADNDINQLLNIESKAQNAFDAAMTALEEKQTRRRNPRPEDTRAELLKLDAAIDSAAADVDIARSAYERANATRVAAGAAIMKEERAKLVEALLAIAAVHVREADARYCKPLAAVLAFLEERAACVNAIADFNATLAEGEEPLADPFEAMRITAGIPERVEEVEVMRRVRPDHVADHAPMETWPQRLVKEKQFVPRVQQIVPTPLHEIFHVAALLPGQKNYAVAGVRRSRTLTDPNGADFTLADS
jgi:hypothetical protein